MEGKLPAVPETILKRRQAENPDLRAKKAVKSKVVFKLKKVLKNFNTTLHQIILLWLFGRLIV